MSDVNYQEGQMLLIDKPYRMTSFGVVNRIRGRIRAKYGIKKIKVGHAGTLDPLATGLLIVLTGKKTKEIQAFTNYDKAYSAVFKLGATTPCYDREMDEENHKAIPELTTEELNAFATRFTGDIEQRPPVFSAIKVDGKKLYEGARKGEEQTVKLRRVTVMQFDVNKVDLPFVHVDIHCSKGTYIRSLAHDFGQAIGCGAYLHDLRRTAIGPYNIDQCPDAYPDIWENR
jgi:tRNA pseudouridine55 synthase